MGNKGRARGRQFTTKLELTNEKATTSSKGSDSSWHGCEDFFFLVKCEQWLFFPLNFLCPTVQAKFLMLKPYVMSLQTKIRRVASLVLASVDGEWQGTAV